MKNLFHKKVYFKSKPLKKQNRIILYIKLICLLLVVGIAFYTFMIVNSWFNTHYFSFVQPIEVKLNQPISIKERKPIIQKIVLDYPDAIDSDIERYIVEKFGVWDAKIALAIASAESGLREEAYHVNTNGSVDIGIFQINSVHFKRTGCSLKELTDQYKNVDCAFQIFQEQGFTPWVAYKNGSYLIKL